MRQHDENNECRRYDGSLLNDTLCSKDVFCFNASEQCASLVQPAVLRLTAETLGKSTSDNSIDGTVGPLQETSD